MGNRAVITWDKSVSNGVGVYVHWNGGRDSVEGFLKFCELSGFRSPEKDNYGLARFVQVIANYFGGDGLSVGVDICKNLDRNNGDNGVYICEGWKIVERKYHSGSEQAEYQMAAILKDINEQQPESMRLTEGKLAEALG